MPRTIVRFELQMTPEERAIIAEKARAEKRTIASYLRWVATTYQPRTKIVEDNPAPDRVAA